MTETEEVKKANPDYSDSAENLTQPDGVMVLMNDRLQICQKIAILTSVLMDYPEAKEVARLQQALVEQDGIIKTTVQTLGGLQDTEAGIYALQQRKISVQYNADAFVKSFPDWAPAVTETAVSVDKIRGLIKGKLLTADQLRDAGVTRDNVTLAWIIKDRRLD